MPASYDERVLAAIAAREKVYASLGQVSENRLAPLINPMLMGSPEWPCRPAWRSIVRPNGNLIITSDGLSDPWEEDDAPGNGFGLEVLLETDDRAVCETPFERLGGTWAFLTVYEICNTLAGHGGVRELIEELGTVSVEVQGGEYPSEFRNEAGRVGVLLNAKAPDIPERVDLPEGDALLVPITTLLLPELEAIVAGGDPTRDKLTQKLADVGVHHRSSLGRASVW